MRAFLAAHPATVERACFGVAGPVRNGHVKTTNLAWPVDAASLAAVLGLDRVGLVNDLVANAYGIAELGPDDIATLNEGDPARAETRRSSRPARGLARRASSGTARATTCSRARAVTPTSGPANDAESALRAHLAAEHSHVSYERVCSGMGLVAIHGFLRLGGDPADWLAAEMAQHDPAGVIAQPGSTAATRSARGRST